ncbi:MAG: EAL domain-containing protein [Lachnospiraceae bacterium]|nr:EAL domain-containing protein [Lachnospiraceae bacterium]
MSDQLTNEQESSSLLSGNSDRLTGLPDMNEFFIRAEAFRDETVSAGLVPALIFFDFNGMKNYNIRFGFAEGDKLIRAMAELLVSCFGKENCGRFGGDRFAAFTKDEGLEEKLDHIMEESRKLNEGKSLPLRAGIYSHSMGKVNAGIACDRAKMACDIHRGTLKSGYAYFSEKYLAEEEKRQYIIDNIDKAIEEGWIRVYYQPIIRASNGRVCDEEALARWIDPVRGFMSPADFIPVLEDTRLIYKLDLFMAEQILNRMKKYQTGKGSLALVPCSINISRSDFESCDIVEEIRRRVDEAGIERSRVTIKITESVIGTDFDYMKTQAEKFRELGFGLWMDDYGSGYSSPIILQKMKFDTLKLDMEFLRHFDESENSRIILSNLIKMAAGLGIETVCEGVETAEQAEFLMEAGCTKLQGYYFCKPLPLEAILERYDKGIQIGFEDPSESDYYRTIGSVNLQDLSSSAGSDERLRSSIDAMPMAIIELGSAELNIIRSNSAFRSFFARTVSDSSQSRELDDSEQWEGLDAAFMREMKHCAEDGVQSIMDMKNKGGETVHILIRRVAVNPVNDARSMLVVILGISEDNLLDRGLTYAHIAQALSADYMNLYYVNVDNEDYTEYRPDPSQGDIAMERKGSNFFGNARRDAAKALFDADRELFASAFTRENVLKEIDEHGAFNLNYRLIREPDPIYVSLKAIRIGSGGKHIIIGVSNVDAQMKQREQIERVREERIGYSRVMALTGDFLVFYTVDPETEHFYTFNVTKDFDSLNVELEGEDFFARSREDIEKTIWMEDLDMLRRSFTRENVLKTIREKGLYSVTYRLVIKGEPRYVCLKAALVKENGRELLIIGVNDIDDQVKRDEEYARNLSQARARMSVDALTGVKDKHAYIDLEAQLNEQIAAGSVTELAIVVSDVNDVQKVNESLGQHGGDAYLKKGCTMICEVFRHSPVFRVGGDEFVAIARGRDYDNIETLMQELADRNLANRALGTVTLSAGMARLQPGDTVELMYRRADAAMRENKKEFKNK